MEYSLLSRFFSILGQQLAYFSTSKSELMPSSSLENTTSSSLENPINSLPPMSLKYQRISWKTYELREADSRPKLAWKLCVCVLNSRTVMQKFQQVFTEIFCVICVFIHQKTDKQSKNCLLLSKISQPDC